MFKRTLTFLAIVCFLTAGMLLAPKPAAAQGQNQTYYTMVSEWAVPRAQWTDFEKARIQTDSDMQKLVADGTLVAYGHLSEVVHGEEGYTHADWFTSPSQAGIMKTLDTLRSSGSSTGAALVNTTKHYDIFMHTLAHAGKTASTTSGYARVGLNQVKPGHEQEFVDMFNKYIKPSLDAQVADGTILMYNFDQSVPVNGPSEFAIAVAYPDAAGLDKGVANRMAVARAHPEIAETMSSITVPEAHREIIFKVLAYQHQ